MLEHLDMGAYNFFVWGAYGCAALVLLGTLISTLWRSHRIKKELEKLQNQKDAS